MEEKILREVKKFFRGEEAGGNRIQSESLKNSRLQKKGRQRFLAEIGKKNLEGGGKSKIRPGRHTP